MNQIVEQISHIGIAPIIAVDEAEKTVPLARALVTGDLSAAEVTSRTVAGEEAIRRTATEVLEMLVGAGTVLTIGQVDRAIAARAQFVVSPGFNPAVTRYVIDRGVLMMLGITSPGEVERAMSMGLDVVKFFLTEQNGGMAKLKALTGPYTNLRWMLAGGVNTKDLMDYLSFDKVVVCGGTWMVKKDLIEGERRDEITRICRGVVQTMLGFELRHVGINCDNKVKAEKTARIFCAFFQSSYKPGNSSAFAGSVVECMENPYLGKHRHAAIDTNSAERIIYHLGLRGMTFDETARETDGVGKTKATYLDSEVGDFALQLTQK